MNTPKKEISFQLLLSSDKAPKQQGVSLALIKKFVEVISLNKQEAKSSFSSKKRKNNISTTAVCEKYIKPLTTNSGLSFLDFLKEEISKNNFTSINSDDDSDYYCNSNNKNSFRPVSLLRSESSRITRILSWVTTESTNNYKSILSIEEDKRLNYFISKVALNPDLFYGNATIFVSHAWNDSFLDLVDALEEWQKNNKNNFVDGIYFWIDLFVNNQHDNTEKAFDWWCDLFHNSLVNIGYGLIVLNPWYAPTYTTRAWCLYEFSILNGANIPYEIILASDQKKYLLDHFHSFGNFNYATGQDNVFANTLKIDIENAKAWKQSDLDSIKLMVRETIGFASLNRSIINRLQRWIANCAVDVFNNFSDEEKFESILPSSLNAPLVTLGDLDTWALVSENLIKSCIALKKENSFESFIAHLNIYCTTFLSPSAENYWVKADECFKKLTTTCWDVDCGYAPYDRNRITKDYNPQILAAEVKLLPLLQRCSDFSMRCRYNNGKTIRDFYSCLKDIRRTHGYFHPVQASSTFQLFGIALLYDLPPIKDIIKSLNNFKLLLSLVLDKTDYIMSFMGSVCMFLKLSIYRPEHILSTKLLIKTKKFLKQSHELTSIIVPNFTFTGIIIYCYCLVWYWDREYDEVLRTCENYFDSTVYSILRRNMIPFITIILKCTRARCLAHLGRYKEAETILLNALNKNYPLCLGNSNNVEDNPFFPLLKCYLAEVLLLSTTTTSEFNDQSNVTKILMEAEEWSRNTPTLITNHFGETYWCSMDSLQIRSSVLIKIDSQSEEGIQLQNEYNRRLKVWQISNICCK